MDGETDMTKWIVTILNFANAPKTYIPLIFYIFIIPRFVFKFLWTFRRNRDGSLFHFHYNTLSSLTFKKRLICQIHPKEWNRTPLNAVWLMCRLDPSFVFFCNITLPLCSVKVIHYYLHRQLLLASWVGEYMRGLTGCSNDIFVLSILVSRFSIQFSVWKETKENRLFPSVVIVVGSYIAILAVNQ